MAVRGNASWARIPGVARLMRRWAANPADARSLTVADRPFLTPEQFQEELEILGLSGRTFDPEGYMRALAEYLDISVTVHVIPDDRRPELSRHLALSGRLGEVRLSEELGIAAIFVPGSLPPLVSDLTILHELGHLAAGDLLIPGGYDEDAWRGEPLPPSGGGYGAPSAKRLARALPYSTEDMREHEANLRASYALVAGCLGAENPYVHDLYNVP